MSALSSATRPDSVPAAAPAAPFLEGLRYFGEPWPEFARLGAIPVLGRPGGSPDPDAFAYQTALAADALRFLALQLAATKASGHPGGFCSGAEAHAALVMLGHKNIMTEVGHHAPGYYASLFLDGSLEGLGIRTVAQLGARFRESNGLLGHLSGAIPGILNPAGPLGQGQHFAMAAALLHRTTLFPVTLGDGGMGEPYVMSAFQHFRTAFPAVTNFLPVLLWNGYSQEHHSMVSTFGEAEMTAYWSAHGFREIVLVDAKAFDDAGQDGPYVDGTRFSLGRRLAFTARVVDGLRRAATAALAGTPTVFILKQIKGAGAHLQGSKSHHLYPQYTLEHETIVAGLRRRALPAEAWAVVRENFRKAAGGPAAQHVVTERERVLAPLGSLPLAEHPVGPAQVPATAIGPLAVAVGRADPDFLVANADGNEASGLRNVSDGLVIRHPTGDPLYSQGPDGRVYEPISEDACSGLTGAIALLGGRSLWCSYESFAVNGLPFFQTVTQAMAELRRRTPAVVALFTASALEQARNGWTHQRPEIEGYLAALMRNGNVYPLFPVDANGVQAAYEWALAARNRGVPIFCSKTALPVRLNLEDSRRSIADGAALLYESAGTAGKLVTFAAAGDLIQLPVFEAKETLEAKGRRVRIVAVVSPRRLYRPDDVAWSSATEPDGAFLTDARFDALFGGDALLAVTGGAGAMLEPLLLRSKAPRRDLATWKRGDTAASAAQLLALNGLDAASLGARAERLLGS
ncbi:MAG: phosphoketolase [Opitutaceae bacterium]